MPLSWLSVNIPTLWPVKEPCGDNKRSLPTKKVGSPPYVFFRWSQETTHSTHCPQHPTNPPQRNNASFMVIGPPWPPHLFRRSGTNKRSLKRTKLPEAYSSIASNVASTRHSGWTSTSTVGRGRYLEICVKKIVAIQWIQRVRPRQFVFCYFREVGRNRTRPSS